MKKAEPREIYIYERDPYSLKFLKSFFRGRKGLKATFFKDAKGLEKAFALKEPGLLVLGSPDCLEEVIASFGDVPLIAMASKDTARGLASVVKNNIEFYLLAPYHKEDFEYKLMALLNRKTGVDILYRKMRDLEAIVELTYLISSTLDPKEVLYFVVKKLSEFIKVTRCSIISLGYGENRYAYVLSTYEDPSIKNIRLDLKKYPEIRKALRQRKPVIIRNALKDPLMKSVSGLIKPLGIRSIVVIPMVYRDEVIGTLFLRTSRAGHVFSDREIKLCQAIANAAVNPLYNAFLFERLEKEKAKLERLAITDYLTGSFNVRYLYHRLEEEFQRSSRYGNPLICIMFDIDFFKRINDSHGHRVGDLVLREFAGVIKRQIRKSDVFARYGGEEFVLILPQTSLEGGLVEAERLRNLIKGYRFKALGDKGGITVSMGLARYPDERIKVADDLITLADNGLFEAKNSGRDRIVAS